MLAGGVMGSRFRRNFGLSSRSPTRAPEYAAPLAARAGDMILAPRPHRRGQVAARILFWSGMLGTIAGLVVYLYLTR
jgi:hypothetical protein